MDLDPIIIGYYCLLCLLILLLVLLLWDWLFPLFIRSRRIHEPEMGGSSHSEQDSEEDDIEARVQVKRLSQTRFHLALEQLPPPTNYRSRSSSQGTSIYGGCPICLEDFEEGESCQVIPECNHIFHWPCIEEWLMENQTCPVCRRLLLPRKEAYKFPIPSY
ncbi:E3 ubiquitin-protein ligase RING1-like [Vitis riparia]|uniref:E3 ubiquitin-protein ligase RING1-like n=1 Tax=Vitis riparia TaxID=96939 RepID=UPI00155B0D2B|nr:E3 ubiquitin-protein ligase RING1-like [Vitis riparia]